MGQGIVHSACETSSLKKYSPCSNLQFCYSSSTVLNIHSQALRAEPWKHTWTTNGRFNCRTRSSAANAQHWRAAISMKVAGATKPDLSDTGAGSW